MSQSQGTSHMIMKDAASAPPRPPNTRASFPRPSAGTQVPAQPLSLTWGQSL